MSFLFEETQARSIKGMEAQDVVVRQMQQQFGKRVKGFTVATVGRKTTDVVVTIDKTPIKFEVKSIASRPRIAIYDRIVHLGTSDSITGQATPTDKVIDEFVRKLTGHPGFNHWIMAERKKNKEIGYFGQQGVTNKAGKIPNPKTLNEPSLVGAIKRQFLTKLRNQEITYLAMYYEPAQVMSYYYTGYGENILNVSKTPTISSIMIDTYGDPASADKDPDDPTYMGLPGKNAMRVALKANFKL